MKLVKIKLMTALFLAGLMFNLVSFSTTPVAAQDTSSISATSAEPDPKFLPVLLRLAVGLAGALAGDLAADWLGKPKLQGTIQYPAEALD